MTTYTVVKGDTIETIARKHKLRDGKMLWHAPENKDLVGRRKKPENLQPGDKVAVPPTEKERKEAAARLTALTRSRDANLKLRDMLCKDVARRSQSFNAMVSLMTTSRRTKNDLVNKLEDDIRSMQNIALGVDTAAAFVRELLGSVLKLAKLGKAVASASGAELLKISREAASQIADVAKEKAGDAATEMAIERLKEDDTKDVVATVMKINDTWDLIQQPSFWAQATTQLMQGKSLTQAVKGEVGDDLRERSRVIENLHSRHDHQLREATRCIKAKMLENAKLLKECQARIQSLEEQIKALG
jgi:hypothetical protein